MKLKASTHISFITQAAGCMVDLFTAYYIVYLHDQNKSGFFGRPVFFQPIRAF